MNQVLWTALFFIIAAAFFIVRRETIAWLICLSTAAILLEISKGRRPPTP